MAELHEQAGGSDWDEKLTGDTDFETVLTMAAGSLMEMEAKPFQTLLEKVEKAWLCLRTSLGRRNRTC